jgi:SEC-C motif
VSLASWFRNLFASASAKPQPTEIGRNDLCWCGSGKKYKKCHLKSDELKRVEARYSAQVSARNSGKGGVVPGKGGKAKQRLEKAAEPDKR